jgi:hypothetical protein
MATIPEELQRLWAERDRKKTTDSILPVITLEEEDGGSPVEAILDSLEDTLEEETVPQPVAYASPAIPTHTSLEKIKCFPAYDLTTIINPAKYESCYERGLRRPSYD